MLTSLSTLSSSAKLNSFSSKSVASSSSPVAVSTRPITQQTHQTSLARNHTDVPRNSVLCGSSTPIHLAVTKKRKPVSSSALPRGAKRLRTTDPLQKRLSSTPSRGSSRQRTLAPSPEPIYRSSRLNSVSSFHGASSPIPRQYWIEEDGVPGPRCLSSEEVVKSIMRSYKARKSFNSCGTYCDMEYPHQISETLVTPKIQPMIRTP
jgi:H3 lysine-79-specific histone-lysine N-methyltransferase